MMRRLLLPALALSTALSTAFALAPARAADAPVTLTLVAADYGTGPADSSQAYWQRIADDFHAANPAVTVTVQTVNWNDFDTKIQTMVQNRQYPDITEGDYFSNYAQEGLLYKMSDVLDNSVQPMPVFRTLGSYEGAQYGIPFTTSSRALFFNKKLFAEAGIAEPPRTWDELRADAAKIAAKGHVGYGLPLGPEEAQAETLLWFLGNGGGYQNKGEWAINSAQNVEALRFVSGLAQAGATEPNPGTKNRADLLAQFAQGQVGMLNGLTALLPIIRTAGVLRDEDWGTAAIVGKAGPLDATLGVCDFVAAFKTDGRKQDAIRRFLIFAYQDKYQVAFSRQYNLLPGTTSAAAAMSQASPALAPFVAALPRAVQYPNDPAWAQVKAQIQQTVGTAVGADPKAVLDRLQQAALKAS